MLLGLIGIIVFLDGSSLSRPAQGKVRSFNLLLFLRPSASREQGHAQACVKNPYQTNKPKQHSEA
jgi:hypothetical protein